MFKKDNFKFKYCLKQFVSKFPSFIISVFWSPIMAIRGMWGLIKMGVIVLLRFNDKIWDKAILWIRDKWRISLIPTFVRFSIIPFMVSIALFFIALAMSIIPLWEGKMMWLAAACFIAGFLILVVTGSLLTYYLRHQNIQSPETEIIKRLDMLIQAVKDGACRYEQTNPNDKSKS